MRHILIVFLALIIAFLVPLATPLQVRANPGWLEGWDYRQEFTINSITDLANYQVMLTAYNGSGTSNDSSVFLNLHAQSDFDDIRFTTSTGEDLLDYWIQEYTASTNATVWVELDSLSPGDSTFYIYYGNVNASSASDGNATFSFFDDFLGSSLNLSRWTVTHESITVEDSYAKQQPSGSADRYYSTNTVLQTNESFMTKYKIVAVDANYVGLGVHTGSTHLAYWMCIDSVTRTNDGSNEDHAHSCPGAGTENIYEIQRNSTTSVIFVLDGAIINTHTSQVPTDNMRLDYTGQGGNTELWADWAIIRNFYSPEPTWGTWGSEGTEGIAVSTYDATSIEETSATLVGNITDVTGGNATTRGFEWDTDSGVPYANSWNESGDYGVGNFSHGITSLTRGELYYYRAYAINIEGQGNGSEVTFLTKPDAPSSFTATAVNETVINLSWAKGDGASNTYIRGEDGSYPANVSDGYPVYSGVGTSWQDTGLIEGHTYYYRAWSYITEGGKEQYSDLYAQVYETTVSPPTVITSIATSIREDSATLQGNLVDMGGRSPLDVYFQYGLISTYGTNTSYQSRTTTGAFYQTITGLYPGTLYHFRAVVRYDDSFVYGVDSTFVSAVSGGSIREEYYDTGDDGAAQFYGGNWLSQTFTTNSSYTVSSIMLELYRNGTPGIITVGIRATNATGCPVGPDLVSGTLSGNTLTTGTGGDWYTITMSSEYALETNTIYGIVFRAVAGDINNSGYARYDGSSPAYAGGAYQNSSNGGTSWTTDASKDFMFAVYGIPSLEVKGAEVFSSYFEDDDWLIVISYRNTYAPYYPYGSIEDYFRLQLMDDSAMVAQAVPTSWGLMPGSIYLSADTVTALEWGANYTIRMQGIFTGNPSDSYTLTSNDWRGDNLALLDSWCLGLAYEMEDYYDTIFVAWSAEKGNILNEQAGAMFEASIPELSRVRPGLFQVITVSPGEDYEDTDFDYTYEEELEDWETTIGPELAGIATNVSGIFHMGGGKTVGALAVFIVYVLVAGMGVVTGHFMAGLTLATPVILVGAFMGLIPLVVVGVFVILTALLFVRAFWWSST